MEATALLTLAGKHLGKWMVEEAKYLYAVKDKVEGLQSELEWIRCFLRKADSMKSDNKMVRKWISEISDFSYEAEDILEKYLLKVSQPRKSDGFLNGLKWSTCVAGDAISTHQVGVEIDALTCKISKLASRMITYGVKPSSYGETSSTQLKNAELRRTYSFLQLDDTIGLENDKNVLVDKLMNKETKVISISGMGGSGKTTLARKVYQAVKGHQFEKCAWMYVSQKFQPRDIIQGILQDLCDNDQKEIDGIRNAGVMMEKKLFEVLMKKKCLVVLDDLWNPSDWDLLKKAFPIAVNESRSKLLITTRKSSLITHIDPQGFPYKFKGLGKMECEEIFFKQAFLGKKIRDPEQNPLVNLGMKMIDQCKGLPLAIVVLAGLLATKNTLEEWEVVYKNVETFLSKNDEDGRILNTLELSYTDLPYHLKPCFLHLGNFPRYVEIPTKKLYRLWISEGLVMPTVDNYMDLECTASSYLQELVQRCVVQVVKKGPTGKIKACRLHDLMWDMCTIKAKEENFLTVVRQENANSGHSISSAISIRPLHRLAIHSDQSLQRNICAQFNKVLPVRSLMLFSSDLMNNDQCLHSNITDEVWLKAIINNFNLLRVLDLENTGIQVVPEELGNLIHLRYLSFMGTRVRKLSSSIRNLRCLQTLDLRVSLAEKCVFRIPNVLWRMKKLKHLYLPSHAYKVKRFQKLSIKSLSNLEILKNFDTTRSRVKDLYKLENIKKLSIKDVASKTKTVRSIMECQSIKSKNLVHLSLKVHGATLDEEPKLLSSCICLHTLEIAGNKSAKTELRLDSIIFPENLTTIVIKNCKLVCADAMQNLQQLRKLVSLCLDEISFPENILDCSHGGFSELVALKLSHMDLKEWKLGSAAMSKLRRLDINECTKLQTLPDELSTSVEVICKPCVKGIDKFFTCPYHSVQLADDDDDDLATQYWSRYPSLTSAS
ncbi:unnamed protein product [Amaranthus hypochondriacus]